MPLVNELVPLDISLDSIYLDPNNPRFVVPNWVYVPDSDIENESIQEDTRRRLVTEFRADRLRMNMEVNGYLPIDRVIVREFAKSKYVVLEGNRRICSAKLLSKYSVDGSKVSEDILKSLETIPCLQYVGDDPKAAWIFQGLRHITGIIDWSQFNKARLLVEQMEEEELSLTDVGKRFGLTPYGAGQWVRGYYAFKQAREESDFINEVDERSYTYFQELFSRSSAPVREWIEWGEDKKHFTNVMNFNEFISWIYPRPDDVEEGTTQLLGDWELRVIQRQDHVRKIGYLIRYDKEIFEKFRRELDVERSYSEAITKQYEKEVRETYDPVEEVLTSIRECTRALDNIPYKLIRDSEANKELLEMLEQLEQTIASVKK